jgi:hypothetical protein
MLQICLRLCLAFTTGWSTIAHFSFIKWKYLRECQRERLTDGLNDWTAKSRHVFVSSVLWVWGTFKSAELKMYEYSKSTFIQPLNCLHVAKTLVNVKKVVLHSEFIHSNRTSTHGTLDS